MIPIVLLGIATMFTACTGQDQYQHLTNSPKNIDKIIDLQKCTDELEEVLKTTTDPKVRAVYTELLLKTQKKLLDYKSRCIIS